MPFIVEQVQSDGSIVEDYDQTISVKKLYERIQRYFPEIYHDENGMICGKYQEKIYSIRAKNVSYLGNPHPAFKKRVQIPHDLPDFYEKSLAAGYEPILLGVYTYGDTELFCAFRMEDFVHKKANNSSAHVYCSDLADAVTEDYFQKTDYFGNQITVFSPKGVLTYLDELFNSHDSLGTIDGATQDQADIADDTCRSEDGTSQMTGQASDDRTSQRTGRGMPSRTMQYILEFFQNIDRQWQGISCYQEMIAADYRNKYQPEWAGFYLEFLFEKYLEEGHLHDAICYAQDKTRNGIDLDLYFPQIGCYGDLKAHSFDSRGVQGNDWDTVFSLLDKDPNAHLYYLICEHTTVKDRDCGYQVTEFWNRAQGKANLHSYSTRMKNSVTLIHFYLLDINNSNKKYLSQFKQGINSNGKPRPPKIMIEKESFDKFILADLPL